MDPEATLRKAEDAVRLGAAHWPDAIEALADLCGWLARGGLKPAKLEIRLGFIVDRMEG